MAQPSRYTSDLAARILQQLCLGRPLRAVCADPGMPSARTVQGWGRDDVDGFAAAYRAARSDSHPRGAPVYTPGIAATKLFAFAVRLPCSQPVTSSDGCGGFETGWYVSSHSIEPLTTCDEQSGNQRRIRALPTSDTCVPFATKTRPNASGTGLTVIEVLSS